MKTLIIAIACFLTMCQLTAGPRFKPSKPHPRLTNSLTIEEILKGSPKPTTTSVGSIFLLYDNTYTWKSGSNTIIKLWEALGKWPGRYPLALQVFQDGKFIAAKKLDFPASSKMTNIVAFRHTGMFVLNLTCRHRYDDYESKCAFSVGFGSRITNGGPVIDDNVLAIKKEKGDLYEAINPKKSIQKHSKSK